jgi:hypothetical protein
MRGFDGDGFVLTPQHVAHPLDCVGEVHNFGPILAEWVGQMLSGRHFNKRSRVSINDPTVNDFETVVLIIKDLYLSGLGIKVVQ